MQNNESIELYTELHRLGRQLHRVGHREWNEHGRHRGQYRLLQLIAGRDGIIQRDLAEEMDMRPSSMTEILVRLEQIGLVRRVPDEKDQRAIHVHLTDAGRRVAEEAAGAAEELAGRMLQGFSEVEVHMMLELTKKLGTNLEAMTPAYGPCGGRGPDGGRGFRHHGRGEERGFRFHGQGCGKWFE